LGKYSSEHSEDVFFQAIDETGCTIHSLQDGMKILQKWNLFSLDAIIIHRDSLQGIGRDERFFYDSFFVRCDLSEHESEESYHVHDSATQEVSRMRLRILESSRQVERIDFFIAIQADIEIRPSYSIHERPIFVLGVEDDDIGAEHERTKYLELDGERFSSTRLREDTHIRVLRAEPVEDDE
jgi:hypothetical protein